MTSGKQPIPFSPAAMPQAVVDSRLAVRELAVHNPCGAREWMSDRLFGILNMDHADVSRFEIIRDKRSMTPPPQAFGTHYCRWPVVSDLQELLNGVLKALVSM